MSADDEQNGKLFGNRFPMNFLRFIDVCKRLGIRILLSINACESEYLKCDNSGNIYESRKISSSVNVVWN